MRSALSELLMLSALGSILGLALILLRRLLGTRVPSAFWYYAWLPVMLRLMLPLPGLLPTAAVLDLTAGHTLDAGMCAGAVLDFRDCDDMIVGDCGLFGCGTYGVLAQECTKLSVKGNEIYECSLGAVHLSQCDAAVFAENDIHDCAYPTYAFYESTDITVDGRAVSDATLTIDAAGPYKRANAE